MTSEVLEVSLTDVIPDETIVEFRNLILLIQSIIIEQLLLLLTIVISILDDTNNQEQDENYHYSHDENVSRVLMGHSRITRIYDLIDDKSKDQVENVSRGLFHLLEIVDTYSCQFRIREFGSMIWIDFKSGLLNYFIKAIQFQNVLI